MSANTAHKAKRSMTLALVASIAAIACFAPMQPAHSAPTTQDYYKQFLQRVGSTQLGAGTNFSSRVALPSASKVTLMWKTSTAGAVQGRWQVTNRQAGGTPLLSGFVTAPAPGQTAQFTIDFSQIAPAQPPAAASPFLYYVTIQPVNAAQQGLALQSNAVTVVYAKGQ